jgi:hypothetical protein
MLAWRRKTMAVSTAEVFFLMAKTPIGDEITKNWVTLLRYLRNP